MSALGHPEGQPLPLDELVELFRARQIGRRTFLKQAALTGIGASSVAAILEACASGQSTTGPSFKPAEGASTSEVALAIAKQYPGKTINFQVEAGLQAALWKDVKPQWESLSGTTVNIVEVPYPEQFQKAVAAVQAGGGIDCLYCQYNWLPDFVNGGVLQEFGPFFDKYLTTSKLKGELADFSPSATLVDASWDGKQWGYPIDGPAFTLFYRTDIFNDASLQAAYQQKFGSQLAPPKTWDDYGQIGKFLTDKLAPRVYGGVHQGGPGQAMYWWFQMYNGPDYGNGKLFDDNMNPQINSDTGVAVARKLNSFFDFGPPGSRTWGPVEVWGTFLKGGLAMTVTWPPLGRLSAGYGSTSPLLSFVPPSTIAGKFNSALPPGGTSEEASGYSLAIFKGSQVKDLAFAFLTWATAPDTYLDLVSRPFALIKPVRISTFDSPKSTGLWPDASQYYGALKSELTHITPEPKILSSQEYIVAVDQAMTAVYSGTDSKAALDTAAGKWNDLTTRVGKDKQKATYAKFQDELRKLRSLST